MLGRRAARGSRALAEWMAREYCSTPARALSLVLPPGLAAGSDAELTLVAELTGAGRAALAGEARADAAAARAARAPGRERAATASPPSSAPARACGRPRGPRPGRDRPSRRAPRRPAAPRRRERRARPRPRCTGEQGPRWRSVPRGAPRPPPRRRSPGALPAAGRHRVGQDRGLPARGRRRRSRPGARRSCSCPRSRSHRRRSGASEPASATSSRCCTRRSARASATTSGCGCAAARRGSAWGPRSAVFAPLSEIGLIVVDEEHESSYKHEGDPRYDARAVAAARAPTRTARCCWSAAPRRGPRARGSLPRLRLPSRVDGRPLPGSRCSTCAGTTIRCTPRRGSRSPTCAAPGGKAIVLLNRRGWSNFLSCRSCGHVWMCPNCEVALVLHRAAGTSPATTAATTGVRRCAAATAARCRWRVTAPGPSGSSTSCAGARRTRAFPCSGSTPTRSALKDRAAQTLARFSAARAGVLVGTQMVAKGHDFPDVSLGVVLDADQTLRFPDFRAEERTFALDHAARRPRRPRRRRRPGAGADARARRPLDRCSPPAMTPTASSPTSSRAGVSCCAIRRTRR